MSAILLISTICRSPQNCEGSGNGSAPKLGLTFLVLVYQIQNATMHQQKMHQMHQNAPYHYRLCELRNFSKRILDGSAVLGGVNIVLLLLLHSSVYKVWAHCAHSHLYKLACSFPGVEFAIPCILHYLTTPTTQCLHPPKQQSHLVFF